MGWSEGKGLGANQDGSTEAIKMHKKDDNIGIFVFYQRAWSEQEEH